MGGTLQRIVGNLLDGCFSVTTVSLPYGHCDFKVPFVPACMNGIDQMSASVLIDCFALYHRGNVACSHIVLHCSFDTVVAQGCVLWFKIFREMGAHLSLVRLQLVWGTALT